MAKRNKLIYWFATTWLAPGMLSTGIVQLMNMDEEVKSITYLGYPVYFIILLGVWKILRVIVVLLPKFPLRKNGLMEASSLSCQEQHFHVLHRAAL